MNWKDVRTKRISEKKRKEKKQSEIKISFYLKEREKEGMRRIELERKRWEKNSKDRRIRNGLDGRKKLI